EAIRQVAPEVLEELRTVFDDHYCSFSTGIPVSVKRRFAEEMDASRPPESASLPLARTLWAFTWADLQKVRSNYYPELRGVRQALDSWARRFHIKTDWMLDIALHTLQFWEIVPGAAYTDDSQLYLEFAGPLVSGHELFSAEERQFRFEHWGW